MVKLSSFHMHICLVNKNNNHIFPLKLFSLITRELLQAQNLLNPTFGWQGSTKVTFNYLCHMKPQTHFFL